MKLVLSCFLGVFVLMILIPLVATEKASPEFVFTSFNTENGKGIDNKMYIFVLGLLMSQYTLTGYDASAHMVSFSVYAHKSYTWGVYSTLLVMRIESLSLELCFHFLLYAVPFLAFWSYETILFWHLLDPRQRRRRMQTRTDRRES